MLLVETGCKKKPRIAIAGLGIESSTFSPALSDEAAFHAK
jgi:microcystin degradation protein MlrC